jgi:hypothetical protein
MAGGGKSSGVARLGVHRGEVRLGAYMTGPRGVRRWFEGGLGWWRVGGGGVRAGAGEGRAEVRGEGAYVGGHA